MARERERLQLLQHKLEELGCDALLLNDSISLYYLTGLHFSAGSLLVLKNTAHLLVDGRYIEGARERSFYPVTLASETALEKLLTLPDLTYVKRLGFCEESSYHSYITLRQMAEKLNRQVELRALPNPVKELRMIKDPEELRLMRAAATLGSEGYDYVRSLLREGVTERELAAALEIYWLQKGGHKLAFEPIIAFEPSSSEPHYSPRTVGLRQGQSILIDIGVKVDHYHSDMTRVVFFGKPNPALVNVYEIVKKAQAEALKLCRPGVTTGELDLAARRVIKDAGYGEAFSHSLGHGIGLEIHETPRIRNEPPDHERQLMPNMAITIEPGIYLPGIGGVRLEDTIVVTLDGYENLTNRSKNLEAVIVLNQ